MGKPVEKSRSSVGKSADAPRLYRHFVRSMIFGHRQPVSLLADFARALPPVLALYVGLRMMDSNAQGPLRRIFDNSLESWAFNLEMIVGVILPGALLMNREVRHDRLKLFGCVLMVIVGVVMNRLNVGLLGMLSTVPGGYLPRWMEILVTAGIAAGGLLVLSAMSRTLPIFREREVSRTAHA